MTDNAYLRHTKQGDRPTEKGWEFLAKAVTDPEGNVYGLRADFDARSLFARFLETKGDLRQLLLREFAGSARRPTQQNDGAVVIEHASHLLTERLRQPQLTLVHVAGRYNKKHGGRYPYYIPEHLPATLRAQYCLAMDALFDNYTHIAHQLSQGKPQGPDAAKNHAVQGLLPTATVTTVGAIGSVAAMRGLILQLMSHDLPEIYAVGQQVLQAMRQTHPQDFKHTNLVEPSEKNHQNWQRLTVLGAEFSADAGAASDEPGLKLLACTPRDEHTLLAHALHPYTTLAFADLQTRLQNWPAAKQRAAFELFAPEAAEAASYEFEIVDDYQSYRALQQHRGVEVLERQPLQPHLGYTVPDSIRGADAVKLYRESHLIATRLYWLLRDAQFRFEAQYALLLNHRTRWRVRLKPATIFELVNQPQVHRIAVAMRDCMSAVHPQLAVALPAFHHKTPVPPRQSLRALGLE